MLTLSYLAKLHEQYGESLETPVRRFRLKECLFEPFPAISLMGVVNLSPGSWYRESVSLTSDAAIRRGKRLTQDGAHIIDIGAESTLLHTERVDEAQQLEALLPVVSSLAQENVLVSVESYNRHVVQKCLEAGAAIINLTSSADTEDFYQLVAEHDAAVIICYLQGKDNVRNVGDFQFSGDHVGLLYEYFAREIEKAEKAGVQRLWIDPGLGFYYRNLQDSARRVNYQMETFLQSFRLHQLGWPVCQALPHAFEYFEDEVRSAEPFFSVLAALGRVDLIRTHEINKVRAVLKTLASHDS